MPKWPDASAGAAASGWKHVTKIERAKCAEKQKHSQQKSEVTNAIDPKCFVAGVRCGLLQEIKTNQQITAKADAFPSDKQHNIICAEHQRQHEKHEQIQIREKSRVAFFVRHVSGGINVDYKSHAGDDQQHHHGELVNLQSVVRAESAGGNPRKICFHPGNAGGREMRKFPKQFNGGGE